MINLDSNPNENNKEHNEKWPFIPNHLHRVLIIAGSGSGKTNVLLNLIKEQDDIDKKILYANYLSEPKYEFLIKKHEDVVIKYYQNIDEYNPSRKRKILIVFDDMIAGIMTNKKFQTIIKELFIRCRKANISLVFITQSYFSVPKDVRLNSTLYLIAKINNRKELQNIAINHSADIDYNDFVRIYRECRRKLCSFLKIDATLPASDSLRFRKYFFPFYKSDSN